MTDVTATAAAAATAAATLSALRDLVAAVKARFVGKDEIVDVLALGLVAGENVFLYGPPGTAKSALVSTLTRGIGGGGGAFEYLLTRFTEPSELFGPFDLRRLRDGELVTNTAGMLPEASTVFLDEVFNANSAILNSLLLALNERRFRRGQETRALPALLFAGASNHLPEDEALGALFDRFLLRVRCGAVDPQLLPEVLAAGRRLGAPVAAPLPTVDAADLRALQTHCRAVDVSAASAAYLALVADVRHLGVELSDRRAVKIQDLLAASALLSGRDAADASDLWVMRYVWDTDAQIAPLSALVDAAVAEAESEAPHPLARRQTLDPEALAAELEQIREGFAGAEGGARSALKDRLRHLADQLPWLPEGAGREALEGRVAEAWKAAV